MSCSWKSLDNVSCATNAFEGIFSEAKLCVPTGAKSLYEAKQPWRDFKFIYEKDIEVPDLNDVKVINGISYMMDDSKATVTTQSKELSGDIVIPETVTYNGKKYTVTSVSSAAFKGTKISSVVLPNTVTTIDDDAFRNCEQLVSATLPSNIESLGDFTFAFCSRLASINTAQASKARHSKSVSIVGILPDGIKKIGDGCFYGCESLASIEMPSSIDSLGVYCFKGCQSLETVISNWQSLENVVCPANAFDGISEDAMLYVPKGTKSLYEAKQPWSSFAQIIEKAAEDTGVHCANKSGVSMFTDRQNIVINGLSEGTLVSVYDNAGTLLSRCRTASSTVKLPCIRTGGVVIVTVGGTSYKVLLR